MNMQLDPQIKAVFDEIVARTPDIGGTPDPDIVPLGPAQGRSRRGIMVAAAAVAVVGLAGAVALRGGRPESAATTHDPAITPTAPAPTSPTPTTTVLAIAPLVQPGSVVCLSAGADPGATGLCVDELGGAVRMAGAPSEDSFVMPADPDDPAHLEAAQTVADALGLPVRELDPQLVPTGGASDEAVTSDLVIGTSSGIDGLDGLAPVTEDPSFPDTVTDVVVPGTDRPTP